MQKRAGLSNGSREIWVWMTLLALGAMAYFGFILPLTH